MGVWGVFVVSGSFVYCVIFVCLCGSVCGYGVCDCVWVCVCAVCV